MINRLDRTLRSRGLALLLIALVAPISPSGGSAQTKPPTGSAGGSSAAREKVVRYIRAQFGVPETVKLTLGPYRDSPQPGLYAATLSADDGKQKKDQNILVSKDGRFLIVGEMFDLAADPKQTALRAMSTQNQPAQGPPGAPVTIVEYADLQCPMCARLHEFLEKEVVPKYGGKVRVVFKDFPLVNMHDWSMTAAVASQCAYQINPEAYVAYRSLIFQQQVSINAANSRDMLLNLAAQAGIDSLKLAPCLDSRASLPRVEQDMREGQHLNVSSTPTSYINGKMLVGMPSAESFYNAIEEALRGAR